MRWKRTVDFCTRCRPIASYTLSGSPPEFRPKPSRWEDGKRRGHYAGGHYLSACALMYAACGDEDLKNNAGAVVAGLGQCQAALKSGQSQAVTMVPLNQVIHERYAVYWKVNHKTV